MSSRVRRRRKRRKMKKGRKRKRGRRKVYCRELLPHLRFLSGRVSSPSMQVISREKERGCKGVG